MLFRNRQFSQALLVVMLLNIGLLAVELHFSVIAVVAGLFTWHFVSLQRKQSTLPSRLFVGLLALCVCFVLALNAKTLGILMTMVHLLVLAYALKTFELAKSTDFFQFILLGLFVCISSLIFQQSLYFSIVVFIVITANLALLISYFAPSLRVLESNKRSLAILLQSLPLAIGMFIIFPKLPPFWQIPQAKMASTGLSEQVKVGDIANLALSNELAFRVSFEGAVPTPEQRYWRTLVMEDFQEQTWKISSSKEEVKQSLFDDKSQSVSAEINPLFNYQIIAQPSYQKWLYVLATAAVNSTKSNVSVKTFDDFTFQSNTNLTKISQYQVTSQLTPALSRDKPPSILQKTLARNLVITQNENPRLNAFAQQLQRRFAEPERIVEHVIGLIGQQDFYYTLQPQGLTNNSLDEFFFETKQGFCEHYASAFTYLMRAAGIPARLVTGYLGATYNPEGNFYSVYQRDAHAWSEVWLNGIGWKRVDPTAAIAPERVLEGFSSEMIAQQSAISGDYFSFANMHNIQWLMSIRWQLDAIDYQWSRWVLGYNAQRQWQFLNKILGRVSIWKVMLIASAGIALVLLMLWWLNKRKNRQVIEPVQQVYIDGLLLLSQHGIDKPENMSALAFCGYVVKQDNNVAAPFAKFSQYYADLRYKQLNKKEYNETLLKFKSSLRQLKQSL